MGLDLKVKFHHFVLSKYDSPEKRHYPVAFDERSYGRSVKHRKRETKLAGIGKSWIIWTSYLSWDQFRTWITTEQSIWGFLSGGESICATIVGQSSTDISYSLFPSYILKQTTILYLILCRDVLKLLQCPDRIPSFAGLPPTNWLVTSFSFFACSTTSISPDEYSFSYPLLIYQLSASLTWIVFLIEKRSPYKLLEHRPTIRFVCVYKFSVPSHLCYLTTV